MMGQMAVQLGQTEAERRLTQLEEHAKRSLTEYGLLPPDPEEQGSDDGADTPARAVRAVEPAPRPKAAHRKPAGAPVAEAPETDAAPRLPPPRPLLTPPSWPSRTTTTCRRRRWCPAWTACAADELAAVRRYELADAGTQDDPRQDRPAAGRPDGR